MFDLTAWKYEFFKVICFYVFFSRFTEESSDDEDKKDMNDILAGGSSGVLSF